MLQRVSSDISFDKYELVVTIHSASLNSCWKRTTICKINTRYTTMMTMKRKFLETSVAIDNCFFCAFLSNIFQFKKISTNISCCKSHPFPFLSLLFLKISFLYPPPFFRRTCCREKEARKKPYTRTHVYVTRSNTSYRTNIRENRECDFGATSLTLCISLDFCQYACGILKVDEKCPRGRN